MTLPELQCLGMIIRWPGPGEWAWRRTWCEERLYKKGLIYRFEYRERKGSRPWYTHKPSALGIAVYNLARKQYRERQEAKTLAHTATGGKE